MKAGFLGGKVEANWSGQNKRGEKKKVREEAFEFGWFAELLIPLVLSGKVWRIQYHSVGLSTSLNSARNGRKVQNRNQRYGEGKKIYI